MNSWMSRMERMESGGFLSAIRRGFVVMIPVLMAGAVALLIRSFPLPIWQQFLSEFLNGLLLAGLNLTYNVTFGMMSLYLTVSVSLQYTATWETGDSSLAIFAALASAICFALSFRLESLLPDPSFWGPTGVFMALACAGGASRLFYWLYGLVGKRSHGFDETGSEMELKRAMTAIVPLLLTILLFELANALLSAVFSVGNVNELITLAAGRLFNEHLSNLMSGVLFVFLLHFLWIFGIHGGNVLEQVARQSFVPNDTNPAIIVSKSFLDNFVMLGGCGATICLLLAVFLTSKRQGNRRLARSCLPFGIFNINELLVFGFPLVLNPILAIPFLLVPLFSLLSAYAFTAVGLLPTVTATVTWTTPVLLSGYAVVESGWGVVVQLVNIVVGTLIYIPFVRMSEQLQSQKEKKLLTALTVQFQKAEAAGNLLHFRERRDDLGVMARRLAGQLRADLQQQKMPVFYQPQVNADHELCGAEALLRWRYCGELVYPPLVVSLAQEEGLNDALAHCVIATVLRDMDILAQTCAPNFIVSANITSEQLNNPAFVEMVIDMVEEKQAGSHFGLEVTEATSLIYLEHVTTNIVALKAANIPMSIDDFSMGQTSLKYLQDNSFGVVKLDGSLVMEAAENERSREIIHSIIQLGKSLHYQVVAEHIESVELMESLRLMGCDCFQGYLFGKAVPVEDFAQYRVLQQVVPTDTA